MYDDLKTALLAASTIPLAEYEWATRPTGNYGTFQLDFALDPDNGDDLHQDRGCEGSIDLYTRGAAPLVYAEIESILTTYCGGSWEVNSQSVDSGNKMLHREYVFQLEVF